VCGDGLVRGDEGCDDGARSPRDGCDSQCRVERGYQCSGEPSVCTEGVDPDGGVVDAQP
ncbi:unnamed protein product, partial [Laminaria digitata]